MLPPGQKEKSAIFLILPEEDTTKNFMAGLMIQNLSRELFSVADENGGKLKNRVVLFCDELGTMPPFEILPLFSAGRSRRLTLVPIIQSLAQLEKNYGKEGIRFEEPYTVPERSQRKVAYASRQALERSILKRFGREGEEDDTGYMISTKGGMAHTPAPDRRGQRQVKV